MVQINFTPSQDTEFSNSKFLSEGTYNVIIVSAEVMPIQKDPGGNLLCIEMQDEAGGLVHNHRLSLWHTKQDTVQRANRDFSVLCNTLNLPHVGDTDELLGKKLTIDLVPQNDNPKFMDIESMRPVTSPPVNAPAQQVQPLPVTPPVQTPVAGQAGQLAEWHKPFNQ